MPSLKSFLAPGLILLSGGFGCREWSQPHQPLATSVNHSVILFSPKNALSVIQLGQMEAGTSKIWPLHFRNPMPEPVTIARLETSCDCLRLDYWNAAFTPGEEKEVKLRIDLSKEPKWSGGLGMEVQGWTGNGREAFHVRLDLDVVAGEKQFSKKNENP